MEKEESENTYSEDHISEDQQGQESVHYSEPEGAGEVSIDKQYDDEEENDEGDDKDDGAGNAEEPEKQKHPLDKYSDHKLITLVNDRDTEYRHLCLENQIFCNFLQENDPAELEGLDYLITFGLEKMWEKKGSGGLLSLPLSIQDFAGMRVSTSSARRSIRYDSFGSISSIFQGRGPRINLSQKSDLALKAMEEIQVNLQAFLKKSNRLRRNLKAELEEFILREKEIKESIDGFHFNVLVQGVDPLTQRIPAEKFLRWMDDWLKSAQLTTEKLRLRTATLKIQLKKVLAMLMQRQELGENVHAVDFDQLEIENKHFAEKLELKNFQLIEMKRMSGRASLILNNNKKNLRTLQDEYNALKSEVAEKERTIEEIEDECEVTEEELETARDKYDSFKNLTQSYKVPDVMEYVNVKRQLNDVRKEIKVWQRREKIQDITIDACLRQMKNITGSSKIDRVWLENMPVERTSIFLECTKVNYSEREVDDEQTEEN